MNQTKFYKGNIITPNGNGNILHYPNGVLVINASKIDFIGDFAELDIDFSDKEIVEYENSLILPGLIDSHAHLAQFDAIGLGAGELIDWLNKTIFPIEAKSNNEEFASAIAEKFFQAAIEAGSTLISVYTAPFYISAKTAFEAAHRLGIRAFIGAPAMDICSPEYLISPIDKIIDDNKKLISEFHGYSDKLDYIICPRFAGSCSFELMSRLAEIAKKENLFIQTHLSESKKEIEFIKSLHGGFSDYLDIYDKAGLLTEKAIFGHCVYLSDSECERIFSSGAKISHCPSSNRYLKSGIAPIKKYLDRGINIGLGTDVGAGYSLSILDEMRESMESSKYRSLFYGEASELSIGSAFQLATIDGAKLFGLESKIGSLEIGKSADFIVVSFDKRFVNLSALSCETSLLKASYCPQFRKITASFIGGKKVL